MAYNTVTVTTTATKIVDANSKRQSIIIDNLGSVTVFFGPDDSITHLNSPGIRQGGNFEEDNSGGRMWKGPIYAIVETGTCNVRYWEREQNL